MLTDGIFDRARWQRICAAALQNLPRGRGDPDRPRILELNQDMRAERCGWLPSGGYLLVNVPVPDMRVLVIRYPDLQSPDNAIRTRAWLKFAASEEGAKYKIRRNDGRSGIKPRGIVVR